MSRVADPDPGTLKYVPHGNHRGSTAHTPSCARYPDAVVPVSLYAVTFMSNREADRRHPRNDHTVSR